MTLLFSTRPDVYVPITKSSSIALSMMTSVLVVGDSHEADTLPEGTRGSWYIQNIFKKNLPKNKKVDINQAIDILIAGWPKQ